MHILLIEPDVILARSYQAALERCGHSVVTSRSAQGAVHVADDTTPDVVVLELQMPRHNGVEFLYEFRSYYEWMQVPIIIHSMVAPHDLPRDILRQQLGVQAVLHKPATTLAQLCDAVRSLGVRA